ncbi:sensor histidine kinase [Nonomuraea lactucae]|uniref:sensor histidine kinase n=1 Tax=Nonomuraea lactucae TaxID=2249762 RepID=UPI00196603EA|nr:HAMP domain-containing sensor histidine kinase [Nonomuraea lactucae]
MSTRPRVLLAALSSSLSSVRVRATLAATLVVAAALGAAAVVLVMALRGSLQASADAEAARRAAAVAPYAGRIAVPAEPLVAVSSTVPTEWDAPPVVASQPSDPSEAVSKSGGGAEPGSGTERSEPPAGKQFGDPDLVLTKDSATVVAAWAEPGEYAVAAVDVTTRSGPATLWSRVSLAGAEQALRALNGALLPGLPALLLVVAGMTWFSVGRALKPVAAIRAKVADITARDLHQRVPVPRSRDEIAELATTVNGTLDRLETAVGTHKRFVADAAHELRSPIATLRARLELAQPSELTREALADIERLQALAGDLLLLARLDAGEPPRTDDLDLGQVAAEESLRIRRRPELRVELDIEPDVVIQGSHGHLARLVTNLVDNAVRHAATTVKVRVRLNGDQAVLNVLDDGPGIPPDKREAVFDRFTRLDEARARDAGGAGLGLPIARDIAALHAGTLSAVDGGFLARFPAHRPAPCLVR